MSFPFFFSGNEEQLKNRMNFTKNRKGKSEICGSKENRVEKNESQELTGSDTMKECEDKEMYMKNIEEQREREREKVDLRETLFP